MPPLKSPHKRQGTPSLGSQRRWAWGRVPSSPSPLPSQGSPDTTFSCHPLFSVNSCLAILLAPLPISFLSLSLSLHPPWVYSSCPIYRLVTPKPLSWVHTCTSNCLPNISSWMPLGQLQHNLFLTDNHLTQETSGPFSPSSCSFLSRPITSPLCACHTLPSSKPQSE